MQSFKKQNNEFCQLFNLNQVNEYQKALLYGLKIPQSTLMEREF